MLTFPKDNAQFSWTRHIKNKMVFYHLSGAQILRIFRKPDRREEGIAPNTVACMQAKKSKRKTADSKQRPEEIWIMYKINTKQRMRNTQRKNEDLSSSSLETSHYKPSTSPESRVTLISAWRYPGTTKPGDRLPIPNNILEELVKSEDL